MILEVAAASPPPIDEIPRSPLGCRQMLTSQGSLHPTVTSVTSLAMVQRAVKYPCSWGIPCVLQTRWVTSTSFSLGNRGRRSLRRGPLGPTGPCTAEENGASSHLERQQLPALLWVSSGTGWVSRPQRAPSLPTAGESTKKPARGLTALPEKCIPAAP